MASCVIKRTPYGTVQQVSTRDGNKSILFDKIAGIPFLRSEEKALDLYLNTLTEKFKKKFGDWESKVAKNKKAVSTIRYQVMDDANSENIVSKAKTMVNPVLVKKLDDKIEDRELYTTDLSKKGDLYLYDENMSGRVSLEGNVLPDDVDARTVEADAISDNPNTVIDMTLISGDEVKAISPSHEVLNTKDIIIEDTVSSFTYDNGEPRLFFLSGNNRVFDNYEQALQDTGSGNVQVGFLSGNVENVTSDRAAMESSADIAVNGDNIVLHNNDAFMRIASVDSNSNPNSYTGLINNLIKKGYISGTRVKHNDEYYFVGQGAEPKATTYNANVAMGYIRLIPGYQNSFIDDEGRMNIIKNSSSDRVLLSSDSLGAESFSKEEIKTMLKEGRYKELKESYPDIDILAACLFQEDNDLFHSNKEQIIENEKNKDRDLRRAMTQVISRLGVSVMSMSDYLDKYKDKNGSEPSAVALADMGNRIIALADRSGVDDLTEEVSHFLVETYNDQVEIERLLPEVENTSEWAEYSKIYFDIYGKKYSGDKLNNVVRREILGKVIRNEFLNRFEGVTNQGTFIDRLLDLFRNMVTRIQNIFNPSVKEDFDALVKQMADDVLADDPNAFDIKNLDGSDFLLYSVDQMKVNKFFSDAKMRLQAQLNIANRSKSAMSNQLRGDVARVNKAIEGLSSSLDEVNVRESVNNIISAAEAQTNFLTRLVGAYKNEVAKGTDEAKFDLADQQNLDNINTLMLPMIKELRGFINNEDLGLDTSFKNSIVNRIDTAVSRIEALNADVNILRKSDGNAIADRLGRTFGIDKEGREHTKNFLSNVMKDISWLSRWFGTLEHSSNPILRMMMRLISNNNYNANIKTQDDMMFAIRQAAEEGWNIKKMEGLLQMDGDKYSSYLKSRYDFVRFRKNLERAQVEALKSAMPEEVQESVDDIVKRGYVKIGDETFTPNINGVRMNFMSASQRETFDKSMSDWIAQNCKRRYKEGYYKEIEDIYKNAENREDGTVKPISAEARRYVREISSRRYQIKRRFMTGNGRVDWSRLNADPYASQELKELDWSNKSASSLVDPVSGEAKTGKELELAEDIRAINQAWSRWFAKHQSGKGVKKEFINEIRDIHRQYGSAQAFDFLIANSTLQFSDKFWDALGEGRSNAIDNILDEKSKSYGLDFEGERIAIPNMVALRRLNDELKALQKEQKEILRMYRGTSLPGEINYDLMSQGVKDRIRELQVEIQYKNQDIFGITKNPSFDSEVETEYTTNTAFDAAFRDSIGDDMVSFCKKHSTAQNQVYIDAFKNKIDEVKRGKIVRFSLSERRILAKHGFQSKNLAEELIKANSENPGKLNEIVNEYAKGLVLPYFKRFAPAGYNEWLSQARTMDVTSFAQYVLEGRGKGIESYMEIIPAREWREDGSYFDQFLDESYNENSDYGYYQPNDNYIDPEYDKYFGISSGVATKNVEEWNMINRLVNLKRKALGREGYNEGERSGYNLYEIPQVSKSSIERVFNLGKDPKAMTINSIRDLLGVRVDDPIYGQTSDLSVDGIDMEQFRVIPKYYLRELEEPSDVSHDLIRSYTLFMLQSNLYNEKMGTIGDIMGLQQLLLNAKFEKGIVPKASNTYNMFKDWMESHYYGVQSTTKRLEYEVGGMKIDVSKLANSFDKFVRYMNLAFSPAVATTAAVTGRLNAVVEGAVGQYVNLKSLRFADKELLKMSSGYISEVGLIDRRNKLYVLGERMGIYSILDRTKSAGYNRAIRVLTSDLGYEMMSIMNAPLAPKLMIAVMDDTRMDENGKFYRFNSFSRKMKRDAASQNKSMSDKEIMDAWNKLKDRSLYNILEVNDGQVSIKEGFDKDTVEKQMRATQREIRSLDNICDGKLSQEDKSAATRNWMLNFTMAHRGWFQLAFQRRWKKAGYNYSTNQMEEGSNRTLMRYIGKTFSILREDKTRKLFSVINDEWNKMSYWEKTNLYRSMIDMVVFLGGTLVFMAAMGYHDDDDDNYTQDISNNSFGSWLLSLTTYTMIRTVNEMYSQLPGLLEINAVDTMYNPFPVMSKLRDLVMPKNWSFDEVQSGSYKGESKIWRLFAKQTFIKQWYSMKSAEDIDRTMKGWLLNNPIMFFKKKDEEEDELKSEGVYFR